LHTEELLISGILDNYFTVEVHEVLLWCSD